MTPHLSILTINNSLDFEVSTVLTAYRHGPFCAFAGQWPRLSTAHLHAELAS